MSGIAGIISNNSTIDTEKIVCDMLNSMKHHGAGRFFIQKKDNVAFGTIGRNALDKKEPAFSYSSKSDRVYFVALDGCIYNIKQIEANLDKKYRFLTDIDVISSNFSDKSYRSFLDYNGAYVFAIYDVNNREMTLVRDRIGKKFLYYVKTKEYIIFASEIKALLKVIDPKLNKNCISYQAYEFNVGTETLFKDIYCLPPGEYIKINEQLEISKYSYWKIWDNLIDVKDDLKRIETDLINLIEDAVLLRKQNCKNSFGAFISGGVDSSLSAILSKPDYLYTCHYNIERDFDELEYAKTIAKILEKELIIVEPTPQDFHRTREDIIYQLDTPGTWTSFSQWMLAEKCYHQVKCVFTGDGPDELFGGYHRYHILSHDEQIKKLKAMEQYAYLISKYYGSPVERYARLVNRCENQYNKKVWNYLHETIDFYFKKMKNNVIHAMGATDFYTTMQIYLQMWHRINSAFDIDMRAPFIDYRIVQYAFSMPSKYKIKDGVTKWILKKIAKKFIPKKVAERTDKRGFSAPVNLWFGWGRNGKYDRSEYKHLVYEDWKRVFKVIE